MSPTMFSMRLVHVFNVFDVGIQCLYMFINVCQCVSYVFQYKRGAYPPSRGGRVVPKSSLMKRLKRQNQTLLYFN